MAAHLDYDGDVDGFFPGGGGWLELDVAPMRTGLVIFCHPQSPWIDSCVYMSMTELSFAPPC